MTRFQIVYHLLEVDTHTILLRLDKSMPLLVDTKETHSPTLNVVELFRILNTPLLH